jgi:hypothetical protein
MTRSGRIFLALLLSWVASGIAEGSQEPPEPEPTPAAEVQVIEPRRERQIHFGETLEVRWKVSRMPPDPENWDVHVSLSGCADGGSNWGIHKERLTRATGSLRWKSSTRWKQESGSEVTIPVNGLGQVGFGVIVILYKREPEDEERLNYAFNACHTVPEDPGKVEGWNPDARVRIIAPAPRHLPAVRLVRPRRSFEMRAGKSVSIAWQVTRMPRHPAQWDLHVLLFDCDSPHDATVELYEERLTRRSGSFSWTSSSSVTGPDGKSIDLTALKDSPSGEPDPGWLLVAVLVRRSATHEAAFRQFRGCRDPMNDSGGVDSEERIRIRILAPKDPPARDSP